MGDKDVLSRMLSAVFSVQPVPEESQCSNSGSCYLPDVDPQYQKCILCLFLLLLQSYTSTSQHVCLGTAGDLCGPSGEIGAAFSSPWLSSVLFTDGPSFMVHFLVQCHWAVSRAHRSGRRKSICFGAHSFYFSVLILYSFLL